MLSKAGPRTLVIGAGPSGLVAVKTLRERGVDAVAVEMAPTIGGQWVLDNPNGQSAAYESLTTNTTRSMSRLSDFELPPSDDPFVGREELLDWWHEYVETFGLADHITLCTQVVSIDSETSGWRVVSRAVGGEGGDQTEQFDAVVIASGNYWDPRRVDLPGEFGGDRVHSADYRSPNRPVTLAGRHVVVIGIGSTGCEIAAEAAAAGAVSVSLSARSGANISPKMIDGVPATQKRPFLHPQAPIPRVLRGCPRWLRDRVLWEYVGLAARSQARGTPSPYTAVGLPLPPHPFAKRTSVSEGIWPRLRDGSVKGCGEVVALDGDSVVLADGSRRRADVVIEATGYHMTFPFLPAGELEISGDDLRLYRRVLHPTRNDLFVVGITRPLGSFWPIAEVQSMWIAEHLTGRAAFPMGRRRRRGIEPLMGNVLVPAFYALDMQRDGRRRRH